LYLVVCHWGHFLILFVAPGDLDIEKTYGNVVSKSYEIQEEFEVLMKQGIAEYLAHVEKSCVTAATVRTYTRNLSLFLRRMTEKRNAPVDIEDIGVIEIEEYIHRIHHEFNYSTSSLYIVLNALRCFYDYAVKRGWAKRNVAREVKQVKRKHTERTYLTETEIEKVLGQIEHPVISAVAYTLYYTGIRMQECVELELDDIDFNKNTLHVRLGKGTKSRTIPMCGTLVQKLKEYLAGRTSDSEMFFATKSGWICPSYINRELKKAAARAKVDVALSAHMLRHSFGSNLLKNGVDIIRVQKLMGHASISTTAIYMHTNMDGLMDAVEALGGKA
jgi:site-specific recombinase XerD